MKLLGLCLAATIAFFGYNALREGPLPPGPLRIVDYTDPEAPTGTGDLAAEARTVTWRSFILVNPTDDPIYVKHVALLDAPDLRIVASRARVGSRSHDLLVTTSWPPSGPAIRPVEGATVQPRSRTGTQLYLRVQAPAGFLSGESGRGVSAYASASGVRVQYETRGTEYELTIERDLEICEKAFTCWDRSPNDT